MKAYNHKKAVQLINYFAAYNQGSINKMKALKLIWLANRLHLRRYARTVTGDTHYAMEWGAVPSNTKNVIEGKLPSQSVEKQYFDEYLVLDGHNISATRAVNAKVFWVFALANCVQVRDLPNHPDLSRLWWLHPQACRRC